MKLVFEAVAGTAGALAKRIASLDHEIGNDTVEDRPVVTGHAALRLPAARVHPLLASGGEADEVSHGLRRRGAPDQTPEMSHTY